MFIVIHGLNANYPVNARCILGLVFIQAQNCELREQYRQFYFSIKIDPVWILRHNYLVFHLVLENNHKNEVSSKQFPSQQCLPTLCQIFKMIQEFYVSYIVYDVLNFLPSLRFCLFRTIDVIYVHSGICEFVLGLSIICRKSTQKTFQENFIHVLHVPH